MTLAIAQEASGECAAWFGFLATGRSCPEAVSTARAAGSAAGYRRAVASHRSVVLLDDGKF